MLRSSRRGLVLLAALFVVGCDDDLERRPDIVAPRVEDDARPRIEIDLTAFGDVSSCVEVASGAVLRWTPVAAGGPVSETTQVRTLVFRVGGDDEPCFNEIDFEVERPIDADNPRWRAWIDVDAAGGAGLSFEVPAFPPGLNVLIAVQARDASGRVDPEFEWTRNVLNLRIVEAR